MKDSLRMEIKTHGMSSLVRAHSWLVIESEEVSTFSQLAEKLNLDVSYVGKIFRMTNLAPDIQEAIINGEEPDGLSFTKLKRAIPADWNEQRKFFGLAPSP